MMKKFLILIIAAVLVVIMNETVAQVVNRNPDKAYLPVKNYIKNPGAEEGVAGWSETGSGNLTVTTTSANVGSGSLAISYDAAAASDVLDSPAMTIPAGLFNRNCLARILYRGGNSSLTMRVSDGTNVLASSVITEASTYRAKELSFICPSSGTVNIELVASADAAVIYVDEAYLGENYRVGTVSQAEYIGSAKWTGTANCIWGGADTSYTDTAADTDCPDPTVEGGIVASGSKIPGFNVSNLAAGEYQVILTGGFFTASTTSMACSWRFKDDGSGAVGGTLATTNGTSGALQYGSLIGNITITAGQTDATIRLQHRRESGAGTCQLAVDDDVWGDMHMYLYKFPSTTDTVANVQEDNWVIDAVFLATGNISLPTTTTNYSTMSISTGQLNVNIDGGRSPKVPCSSTNPPDASGTCSAGAEEPGIAFTIPRAGKVKVCVDVTRQVDLPASADIDVITGIKLAEYETDSTSQLQLGDVVDVWRINHQSSSSALNARYAKTHHVCQIFEFSSAGEKEILILQEINKSGTGTMAAHTMLIDNDGNVANPVINIRVEPVDNQQNMPVIVNSVVTPENDGVRIASAFIAYSAGTPSVGYEDGDWISSLTDNGVGQTAINITTGTFSSAPMCTVTSKLSQQGFNKVVSTSTSAVNIESVDTAGTTAQDTDVYVICVGAQ